MIPATSPEVVGVDSGFAPVVGQGREVHPSGPSASNKGRGDDGRHLSTPAPTSQEREHDVLALCGQRRTWNVDRDCGCKVCEVLR